MDLTANLTESPTFDPYDTVELTYEPLHILIALTSVASALSNAIIIYVIFRYESLRTRPNLYLANWALCNFMIMLFMPIWYKFTQNEWYFTPACIWDEFYYGAEIGNLFFVVILLVDWFVMSIKNVMWCQKIHWFIMGVTWLITAGISVASLTFCLLDWSYPLAHLCYYIILLLSVIVIIVAYLLRIFMVNILKRPSKLKSIMEPIMVGSFCLCWFPSWMIIYGQLLQLFYASPSVEESFMSIAHSHGWIMLILLIICDKRFRLCFMRGFGKGVETRVGQNGVHKEQQTVLLK